MMALAAPKETIDEAYSHRRRPVCRYDVLDAEGAPIVSGTIEKVDTGANKVTIDHRAIPNLNMNAMTMVFRAQDPPPCSSR